VGLSIFLSVREGRHSLRKLIVSNWRRSKCKDKNPFVETTLLYVLSYLFHLPVDAIGDLDIVILADDDYYSNSLTSKRGSFGDFGIPLAEVHKTGLGSSAALVTALTAALIATRLPTHGDSDLTSRRGVIHNLAQAAHCAAQGKVGSGFDVAAAVYGSCLYRRFTPQVLEYVGEAGRDGFGERLHRCVEDLEPEHQWDTEILQKTVQIPRQLRLVLCDVDCGSQTPGMVKQVLAWREQNAQEADLLWTALQQGTQELCAELIRLSRLEGIAEMNYQGLADIISTIRSLGREMSDKSKVPIEPPAQTALLNACSAVSGVVGGMVPGAGGFDAVVLLVENNETTMEALQTLLHDWKTQDGKPNIAEQTDVKLLGVNQDGQGIRSEPVETYAGWLG
jgi:phosphomevalonate kinase